MGVSRVFRTLHNRGNMKGFLKGDISNFCEITYAVTHLLLYGCMEHFHLAGLHWILLGNVSA